MKICTESMTMELNTEGILIINPPKNFRGPETLNHAKENVRAFS